MRFLLPSTTVALLLALFELPGDVLAQAKKSEIRGVVVRSSDRQPVDGARVSLEGHDISLVTDKRGRFKFPKVAAGQYVIRAEVAGFPPATSTLLLADGDRLDVEFQVGAADGAVTLPELEVTEEAALTPIADFNRRASSGNGRYITRDFIEKRKPATLMDLMRSVPGVRVVCPRSQHRCILNMRGASRGCGPAYFMDGVPSDPSALFLTSPTEIEAIEVYSGPAETPPEFEGIRSGCGAVAIWTRVGRKPN